MRCIVLVLAVVVATWAQFGPTGQTFILNAHYNLRKALTRGSFLAGVTPKPMASNMRLMRWNFTLSDSAQKYAEKCPTNHSNTPGLGENLYWAWTSAAVGDLNIYGDNATSAWVKEFQDIGWTTNAFTQELFDTGIGHATQMAWADTNFIGCGVKNCGPDSTKANMNKVVVVCQYYSPGNILGQDVYKIGTACANCPTGTICYAGLCG